MARLPHPRPSEHSLAKIPSGIPLLKAPRIRQSMNWLNPTSQASTHFSMGQMVPQDCLVLLLPTYPPRSCSIQRDNLAIPEIPGTDWSVSPNPLKLNLAAD
jgi:hypothetical protein